MQEGGRVPAEGAGPGPAVQWRLPLTGSVSYRPGRHGRASQTAAALKLANMRRGAKCQSKKAANQDEPPAAPKLHFL